MAGKVGVAKNPAISIMTNKVAIEDCRATDIMAGTEAVHNHRMTSMMAGNELKVSKATKNKNGDQNEYQWVDTPALLSRESVRMNEILSCG